MIGTSHFNLVQESVLPRIPEDFVKDDEFFKQTKVPARHCNLRAWFDKNFPNRWVGRKGLIEYSARSPDLTPTHRFL